MVDLSTFSANSTGQLDVLGHYGDTFGVDGTQVGVLEQTDQVGFASLLKSCAISRTRRWNGNLPINSSVDF